MRDLGGYETEEGRALKWGQVYRSGEFARLSDEDVARLDELKINTVVNFLLPEESEAVLAVSREVGPVPFEPPYKFSKRMRELNDWRELQAKAADSE